MEAGNSGSVREEEYLPRLEVERQQAELKRQELVARAELAALTRFAESRDEGTVVQLEANIKNALPQAALHQEVRQAMLQVGESAAKVGEDRSRSNSLVELVDTQDCQITIVMGTPRKNSERRKKRVTWMTRMAFGQPVFFTYSFVFL